MLLGGAACYQSPTSADGAPDANPDGDNDGACQPSCNGDGDLATCSATVEPCDFGCSEVGGAHCQAMQFSNDLQDALLAGVGDFALQCTDVLKFTATGQILHGATELRPAGVGVHAGSGIGFDTNLGLAVYSFNSVNIKGCTIAVDEVRLLALVAQANITLSTNSVRGAGNGTVQSDLATGCAPGGSLPGAAGGGGGAGTAGGRGSAAGGNGGAGGAACPNMVTPLMNGSSGGLGAAVLPDAAYGQSGLGGTALQISTFGELSVDASVFRFGGAGGGKGKDGNPAGGGGSGGTVVLEARSLLVTSSEFYANGGNGGYFETNGASGLNSTGPSSSAGGEGRGGTAGNTPGNGTFANATHTGGGGAVGHIRLHSVALDTTGSVSSPVWTTGQPPVK